ncbi:unnamed protein product [Umbelopsis sp. WA50703]|jgi:hypothetical protein
MTEAPRRARSRSANTTPRMVPQQAPMPGTPPQMQGYPGNIPTQQAAPQQLPAQQQPGMNHIPMQEGPGYPSTPYMQQQMSQQPGEQRGIFSGLRRRMREAAGFVNTDPYNDRNYGHQMMGGGGQPPMMGQPMQPGYANGAGSPGAYAGAHYGQQPHVPGQPQMMQQQYMQHSPQYMGNNANPYAYSQTPVMMQQQQPYGGMAYGYGASQGGYYNRGSYGGAYSPYGGAYGSAYGAGAYGSYGGAGGYGGGYGAYGGSAYGMGSYPYSYGYGGGGYGGGGYGGGMGYPRHMPIYDEHGKRIYPHENYVSSVKDL